MILLYRRTRPYTWLYAAGSLFMLPHAYFAVHAASMLRDKGEQRAKGTQ
jgi:hypothetical protein